MKEINRHYIDGEWVSSLEPASQHQIVNPATEEAVGQLQFGGKADVDRAVDAAYRAFPAFSSSSLESRIALLERIATEYEKRFDDLALAISTEMGAPLEKLAKGAHVPIGLGHFRTTAQLAHSFQWREQRGSALVVREAAGVCALVTPWNWPLNQIACKVAPALLAGCTLVLKPSEYAPLSAEIFAEIMHAAEVPAGVFNMIWASGPEMGPHLSSHPKVDLVSLTGSTLAGASVARCAADTIKRVSLELGGKSANVILPHAPLEQAVSYGVMRMMNNSGQSCNAPSRMLILEEHLAEAEAIAAKTLDNLRVGDPLRAETTTGPLANGRQFQRVQSLIEKGINEGAKLVAGGAGRPEGIEKGYFVRPTIFSAPNNTLTIAREEIFGPVLTLIPYRDVEEAIAIANDTDYGLAAYVYSDSLDEAREVGARLRAGQVLLNGAGPDLQAPFGGMKQSGIGREWGTSGIEEFTELKAMLGAV